MKKILLTIVLMLMALPAVWAADNRSIVKVRLSDNSPFIMRIDKMQYDGWERLQTAEKLMPGRHRLRIFLATPAGRGNRAAVYDGFFTLAPGTMNYLIVDRIKGTVRVNTSAVAGNNGGRGGQDAFAPGDRDRYRDHDRDDRGDRYRNRNHFTQQDMEQLKDRVDARITDNDRLNLIKTVLDNRSYSTAQVRTMIGWMNFDDTRLGLARFAYENVTDPRNYWKIEDAFVFGSTKDKFMDFLKSRG